MGSFAYCEKTIETTDLRFSVFDSRHTKVQEYNLKINNTLMGADYHSFQLPYLKTDIAPSSVIGQKSDFTNLLRKMSPL